MIAYSIAEHPKAAAVFSRTFLLGKKQLDYKKNLLDQVD